MRQNRTLHLYYSIVQIMRNKKERAKRDSQNFYFHFFSVRNAKSTNTTIAFRYVSDESASGRISGRHITMGERTLIPSLLTMNLQAVHKTTSLIRLLLYIFIDIFFSYINLFSGNYFLSMFGA